MGHVQNPFILFPSSAGIILPDMKFDFDADLGVTTNASGVTNWSDQSANAVDDLFAESASRSPALLTNGNPSGTGDAIDFDGVANRMRVTAGFTFVQPETVYIVLRWNTWGNNKTAFDGITHNGMFYANIGSTPDNKIFAGTFSNANGDLAVGTWGIVCCVFNNASSSIRVNDNTKTTGTIGTANADGLTVGARGLTTAQGDFTTCRIIGYGAAHSDADQSTNITALNNIYNVF
jgi:hypothetical protein